MILSACRRLYTLAEIFHYLPLPKWPKRRNFQKFLYLKMLFRVKIASLLQNYGSSEVTSPFERVTCLIFSRCRDLIFGQKLSVF